MTTLEQIKENKVYKEMLADSFGGIMYDVANGSKYDTKEILALWDSMTPSELDSADGIVKGALNYAKEYTK